MSCVCVWACVCVVEWVGACVCKYVINTILGNCSMVPGSLNVGAKVD